MPGDNGHNGYRKTGDYRPPPSPAKGHQAGPALSDSNPELSAVPASPELSQPAVPAYQAAATRRPAAEPHQPAPGTNGRRALEVALQLVFLIVLSVLVGQGYQTSQTLDRAALRLQVQSQAIEAREIEGERRDRVLDDSRQRAVRQQADLLATQEAVKRLTQENLRLALELQRRLNGSD